MDFDALVKGAIEAGTGGLVSFDVPLPYPRDELGPGQQTPYRLKELRAVCQAYGSVTFAAKGARGDFTGLTVTIDPRRPARKPYLAVNMIARDDAPGLERAILSALEHVDEIVIGVDGRSDEATRQVAEAYADVWASFGPEEVGLTPERWKADEIHFANARNHTRAMVKSPWTLVIDADEIFTATVDVRRFLRHIDATAPEIDAVLIPVGDRAHSTDDPQRLARTSCRYTSGMHNQLVIPSERRAKLPGDSLHVLHEGSLRAADYVELRKKQRDAGIEALVAEGKQGNMTALYHAAKHFLGDVEPGEERGIPLVEDFRLRVMPHDPVHGEERVYLAIYTAVHLMENDDMPRAEQWAVRALLDGPNVDAFTLLGHIAKEEGDLRRALNWYEAACSIPPSSHRFEIHAFTQERFIARDALRRHFIGSDRVEQAPQPDVPED